MGEGRRSQKEGKGKFQAKGKELGRRGRGEVEWSRVYPCNPALQHVLCNLYN
jgi:hypothetical protein